MYALTDLTIRLMFQRDLPAVLAVEQRNPGRHWTRDDFLPVFDDPSVDGWVAEVDGSVVGYLVFRTEPGGLTLLNIAIAPYWRRHGIASNMLQRLDEKRPARVRAVVPESNLPVHLLLRGAGYAAVRVLRDQFDGEDGYVMER
jgi:[ribosomal protein S18]-alanine N-acetyltransferase